MTVTTALSVNKGEMTRVKEHREMIGLYDPSVTRVSHAGFGVVLGEDK